mgnify:CR=1 FL=1
MRWFKCLILCLGHLLVMISLAFVTVTDEELKTAKHNFLKWFLIAVGNAFLTLMFGSYVIALPLLTCLKKNKMRAHLMIVFVAIFYFTALSIMLWALQHIFIQSTVIQCYAISGQIGLVFGLFVL